MSLIDTRSHQLFPVLDASQVETAKRFASGPARKFPPGEIIFDSDTLFDMAVVGAPAPCGTTRRGRCGLGSDWQSGHARPRAA